MSMEQKQKIYSILEKDKLKSDIENLEHNQQCQVFNIIKKYTDKISENNNGIFINLKYLKDSVLDELTNFIIYCKNNKDLELINNKKMTDKTEKNNTLLEDYNNYSIETNTNSDFIFKNYIDKISTHNIKEFEFKTEEKKPVNRININPLTIIENRIMKKCREINKFSLEESENLIQNFHIGHLDELKTEI